MQYPVGMIPYTNMAPYRELGAPDGIAFVPCLPGDSIAAIADGRIMAAAVPVGGLPVLERIVEPIGMYGIAAKGESLSVLLFSDRPFDRLDKTSLIRLTRESASSVRLLFLLLGYTQGFGNLPRAVKPGTRCNARLIIGDRAINAVLNSKGDILDSRLDDVCRAAENIYVTDLAKEWHRIHQLPFVFARWVVRRDAPVFFKRLLANWLHEFRENEAQLLERSLPKTVAKTGFPAEYVRNYLQVIRRSLGNGDMAGQERFLDEFRTYQRQPLFEEAV